MEYQKYSVRSIELRKLVYTYLYSKTDEKNSPTRKLANNAKYILP